ncbi:TetR family transcriptional regulator [Rhodococcus sp. ACPA1]|uniref:TetR family transcriptional regulator n=1 Tax=Rhodococcus sp. ACPA1 TaxID=2028572 RepID=UPI001C53129B
MPSPTSPRTGYDASSLNNIAAEAGMKKPSLHAHFAARIDARIRDATCLAALRILCRKSCRRRTRHCSSGIIMSSQEKQAVLR